MNWWRKIKYEIVMNEWMNKWINELVINPLISFTFKPKWYVLPSREREGENLERKNLGREREKKRKKNPITFDFWLDSKAGRKE